MAQPATRLTTPSQSPSRLIRRLRRCSNSSHRRSEVNTMSWLSRYRLRLYLRNSIWIFPVISIALALASARLLGRIELAQGWALNLNPDTGRTVMSTIASSMFALVVIASSAVLLVVQLASAQLTPRIIAFVYRSRVRKISLTVFAFTFTFSVGALVRIEDRVPLLTSYVGAYGFLINLALFLYFIDSVGKTVRPSAALTMVALAGRREIHSLYPSRLSENHTTSPDSNELLNREVRRIIANELDGVLLAFDRKGLVSLAERTNCIIELVPQVGDFVAAGDPLFRICDGGEGLTVESLRKSVAFGQERTLEQDPMFALRIIVDIASKALSPAINDPTTAVLSIDQLHHLLRDVGSRSLAEGRDVDSKGKVRLMYRTPNWEDFVNLAVTEIRQYGRDSIQIMRRLRAMLDNLIETLPERRAPLLQHELALLTSSSIRMFPDTSDQDLAHMPDLQGMGGGQKEKRDYKDKEFPIVA
ncbi:MAG: DUF2254 domain-containing protein [Blastocatellia bacterium]|nr:MAG: DUF2254 domain-containing protein [Blastocatellia bacterium]